MEKQLKGAWTSGMQGISAIFCGKDEHLHLTNIYGAEIKG